MDILHTPCDGGLRDNWEGTIGGLFKAGATNVVVTHLGYYDADGDGLARDHHVGIFAENATTLLASVLVTNSLEAPDTPYTNGYRWVALETPFLLRANTTYILAAETFSGSGDAFSNNDGTNNWRWNPAYVGASAANTRDARYGGAAWPVGPESGSGFSWGMNSTYGAPNLATWAVGPAKAGMAESAVICIVGQTATIPGIVNGAAPVTVEWYKAPSTTPLPGKTNATLQLPNATFDDSGDYYLVAKNALGTSQSTRCTLTISATPVNITTNPTNLTVYQKYSATFYAAAEGTPPITYQWLRNGSPISGATRISYTVTAAAMTNNGDTYSCVASNNAPGPFTATSTSAALTVIPNAGQPPMYMHETYDGNRNNHSGSLGGKFTTGDADALVSHLGFFDKDGNGLAADHFVGIFAEDGTLLGEVLIPAGTGAPLANGHRWVALDPPLVLTNRTSYVLAAQVTSGDGDPWPDTINPVNWNPFFVGNNGSSVIVEWTSADWPTMPNNTWGGGGMIYGPPNMALLPFGKPAVIANPSATAQYETLGTSFEATASGQPPVSLQWYKAPATPLIGETNSTLSLTGLTLGDAGDYYAIAANGAGSNKSGNATLTVLPATKPQIVQDPNSLSAYIHQTVRFSVIATGLPPFSFEWKHNGATLSNQTNSTLVLTDVSAASAGNYQVVVTNPKGSTDSATASLTVLVPPAGSYTAAVMEAKPLVYYRFGDTIDIPGGGTNALNLGTLGSANNGTYEVNCAAVAGPQPPTFAQFEAANQAVSLDGVSDVILPALNMDTNSGAHVTMAAWVYLNGAQPNWTGIIFRRGTLDGGGCGFGLTTDSETGTQNMLQYHWRDQYWDHATKLFVPEAKWVFVVFVVEPDKATFYMHDGTGMQSATNVAPHGAASFARSFYVGYDPAAPVRRLNGTVDEVMVFDRSLSPAEVLSLYLGLQPVTLTASLSGGKVVLTWSQGTLQQAGEVTGTFVDVPSAISPYTVTPTPAEPKKFYRVKVR